MGGINTSFFVGVLYHIPILSYFIGFFWNFFRNIIYYYQGEGGGGGHPKRGGGLSYS